MLIILCILFPPALIFVIPYYLLSNRNATRRGTKETTAAIAAAHREAQIVQFAAMDEQQQGKVTEALKLERRRARYQKVAGEIVNFLLLALVFWVLIHWIGG